MSTNSGRKILDDRLKKGYTQYTPEIAAYWDAIIDWEKRRQGEGDFLINILKRYKAEKILDMSCGTGYDSVRLLEEGLKVKSCDGSLFMLIKARMNGEDHNVQLQARFADWRRLKRAYKSERFDAVICLGNSFCHLFDRLERVSVIKQVYDLLKNDNGVFVIDQRNFDKVIKHGFSSEHKYVYCGTQFDTKVIEKKEGRLTMLDQFGKLKFIFDIYPIRFEGLRSLLIKAGFQVESYGDFSKNFSLETSDFFQHVCTKKV